MNIIMNLKDVWNLGKIVGTPKEIEIDLGQAIMKIAKQIDDCDKCLEYRYLNKGNSFAGGDLETIIKNHFKNHLIKVDEE